MNRLFIFLLVSYLSTTILYSQSQEDLFYLEVIDVTYSDLLPDLYILSDDEYEKLKISKDSRGRPNQLRYTPELQLYQETKRDGDTIYEPILKMGLPGGEEHAILFFYMTMGGSLGHFIVNDAPDRHRGGQLRLINLINQDVACMVNNERIMLPPSGEATEDVYSEERNFHFAYAMLKPKPHRSPFKRLPLRLPNHRVLIVITYRYEESSSSDGGNMQLELVPFSTQMYDRVKL